MPPLSFGRSAKVVRKEHRRAAEGPEHTELCRSKLRVINAIASAISAPSPPAVFLCTSPEIQRVQRKQKAEGSPSSVDQRPIPGLRDRLVVCPAGLEPRLFRNQYLLECLVRRLSMRRARLQVRGIGDPSILGTPEHTNVVFGHFVIT